jgi:hypothetical protein
MPILTKTQFLVFNPKNMPQTEVLVNLAQKNIDNLPVSFVGITDSNFTPPEGLVLLKPTSPHSKWTPQDVMAMAGLAGIELSNELIEIIENPTFYNVTGLQPIKNQAMLFLQEKGLWDLFAAIGQGRTTAKQAQAKLIAVVACPEGIKFLAAPYPQRENQSNINPDTEAINSQAKQQEQKLNTVYLGPRGAAAAMAFDRGDM